MSRLTSLDQALEDVEARFLYNLPESELNQVDRLFFQLEQAWWFYEDFMADVNPALPHFKYLKVFAEKIFNHCPLLSQSQDKFVELFNNFNTYKSQIPVCGCIMLNPEMTKVLLVCSWKGKSWGFPRGKINENEEPIACAIRESFEECGYDAKNQCRKEDELVVMEDSKAIKLFIATNVPESTVFTPQTRKEISEAAFFKLDSLPKTTYGVYPFIPKLRRWISIRKKNLAALTKSPNPNKKDKKNKVISNSNIMNSPKRNSTFSESKSFDNRNSDTFADEPSSGAKGWGVKDMFKVNAKLTGQLSS
jgi:mRNA-decapping enzyme subunit 2